MADVHQEQEQKTMEAAKKRLAEQKSAREAQAKEAPTEGKPTPTQEENDLAKLGAHITEHEPDGSPSDDPSAPQTKQAVPSRGAPYQTRQSKPAE